MAQRHSHSRRLPARKHKTDIRAAPTAMAKGVHGALIAMALAAGVGAATQPAYAADAGGQASSAAALKTYRVPAGPLGAALTGFAGEAGVTVQLDPRLVEGRVTQGLDGRFSVHGGFARLLAGSGLEAVERGHGTYVLRTNPSAADPSVATSTLPQVTVRAATAHEPTTTVGSRIPQTRREVPQTVSVIDRKRMDEQNLQTMEDALKYTPGISVERIDANRFNVYSRGFEVTTLQIDGVATSMDDRLFLSPDLAMYERMEVLKGPAGLLAGAGTPGGAVNLVRKLPRSRFALAGEIGAGSWNNYRTTIDLTGPLDASGRLRGRVVGAYQDREFFYDVAKQRSGLAYGVLEYDLTPATLLTAGASHQDLRARGTPWTLPGYNDFSLLDVPRSTALGAAWNRGDYSTTEVFAEAEHKFDNRWSAKLAARYVDGSIDRREAYAWGAVSRADNLTTLFATGFEDEQRQTVLDLYATGPFTLFGREHKLLLGANHARSDFHQADFDGNTGMAFGEIGPINVFNPPANVAEPTFTQSGDKTEKTTQTGVYANAQFSISDPLTFVLGARASWWEREFKASGQPDQRDVIDAEVTPFTGVVYDLNNTYSLYASYAEIFQPQSFRTISGSLLDPLVGKQYETGVKGEFLDGRLNASLALFRIREQDRAQQDPDDLTGDAYIAQGKAQSQGVEAEVSGQVRPGWDVHAGYTYTRTKNLDASANASSAFSAIAPRHIVRLWTNYRLPDDLNQWSVGAGVNAVSKFYNEFGGNRFTQAGYATADARIGYRISARTSIDLSVTNLFDKKYYQRISNPNSGNLYGEPRAFMLTLRSAL